jgi:GT2 family glycosyltransferase
MKLNQLGTWVRSRWGGMPFGDQGFCLRRETWERLGGFDTHALYGEDHLFVWKARGAGVQLRPTGGTLRTSARKYRERGWLSTTTRRLRLTAAQAFPEWLKLVRAR